MAVRDLAVSHGLALLSCGAGDTLTQHVLKYVAAGRSDTLPHVGRARHNLRDAVDRIGRLALLELNGAVLVVWVEEDFRLQAVLRQAPKQASLYGGHQLFANLPRDAPTRHAVCTSPDLLHVRPHRPAIHLGPPECCCFAIDKQIMATCYLLCNSKLGFTCYCLEDSVLLL